MGMTAIDGSGGSARRPGVGERRAAAGAPAAERARGGTGRSCRDRGIPAGADGRRCGTPVRARHAADLAHQRRRDRRRWARRRRCAAHQRTRHQRGGARRDPGRGHLQADRRRGRGGGQRRPPGQAGARAAGERAHSRRTHQRARAAAPGRPRLRLGCHLWAVGQGGVVPDRRAGGRGGRPRAGAGPGRRAWRKACGRAGHRVPRGARAWADRPRLPSAGQAAVLVGCGRRAARNGTYRWPVPPFGEPGYDELLASTVESARAAVGADAAYAMVPDEDGELRLRAAAGSFPSLEARLRRRRAGWAGWPGAPGRRPGAPGRAGPGRSGRAAGSGQAGRPGRRADRRCRGE